MSGYANGGWLSAGHTSGVATTEQRVITADEARKMVEAYREHLIRTSSDETLARGLWMFLPRDRALVLSERARRGILQGDPEPSGDPEYT